MVRPFQRAHAGAKLETYRDNEEWVIVIETCHQCESHRQEWLRHDPQDYRPGSQKKSNWTVIEYLTRSGIKLCGHVWDVQLLKKRFPCFIALCFFLVLFPDLDSVKAFYPINVPPNHCHQSVIPQGLRLKWYDQLARSWTEPNRCRAFRWIRQIWGNEWAPWKSSCFLPRFLRTLLERFGIWLHDPKPASTSRLLRAASNFHEQKLAQDQTYPPFPKLFFASLAGQSMLGTFCIPNCWLVSGRANIACFAGPSRQCK